MPDPMNYPKDQKHAAYPAMPIVTKPRLTSNDPAQPNAPDIKDAGQSTQGRQAEFPVGGKMDEASTPDHNQGVQQVSKRDANPVETPPSLSPRGQFPKSDMTQDKVMEKNDPTHDGKSFKNRSWEGKGFENRRMLY